MSPRWSYPGPAWKSVSDRGPELKRWPPTWMSASGAVARTVLVTEPGVGVGVSTVTSVVAETPPTTNTLATA